MADCCLIKKVATVEVYENKNEVRAYGFMAGDRNTPVMEVRFKHLWGESNLSSCKLRWIIVDDVGSLLVGEVPIQSDNTALINLPNELFTGDRRMKVQLTVASCDGERILNLQQFTDLKVINSLASNEVVEPVYQILINQLYDESQKYLKELETSYTQKYGSLDSLYKSARASLEQYLITAENGGNAEFLQGYSPVNFIRSENTINELINSATGKYKIGDIVDLNGYYTAGDGAHHKRKIESADDGSGVQIANGLWANIVHNGEVNVSWFGASKSKNESALAEFQKAEDYGVDLIVDAQIFINDGEYIVKNTKSNWRGVSLNTPHFSKIKTASDKSGPIVFAEKISDFTFSNLKFEGYKNDRVYSSWFEEKLNLVCLYNAENVSISNCTFKDHDMAIRLLKTTNITIDSCSFTSSEKLDKNKYMNDEYNTNTYSDSKVDIGSGTDLSHSVEYDYNNSNNLNLIVKNNVTDSFPYDCFCFAFDQTWKHSSGEIKNNTITGKNTGVNVYRGTYPFVDTRNFSDDITISENKISYCFQNGVYVRGFDGVIVDKNHISFCGFVGEFNSGTNGGICFRVFKGTIMPSQKEEYFSKSKISENFILNCCSIKKDNGTTGIIVANSKFLTIENNTILNDKELYLGYTSNLNNGIGSTVDCEGMIVNNNQIMNVKNGISIGSGSVKNKGVTITNNTIKDCSEYGVFINNYLGLEKPNVISNNGITKVLNGIRVRGYSWDVISENVIEASNEGVTDICSTKKKINGNSITASVPLKFAGIGYNGIHNSMFLEECCNVLNGVPTRHSKFLQTDQSMVSSQNAGYFLEGDRVYTKNYLYKITGEGIANPVNVANLKITKSGDIFTVPYELVMFPFYLQNVEQVVFVTSLNPTQFNVSLSHLEDGEHSVSVKQFTFEKIAN